MAGESSANYARIRPKDKLHRRLFGFTNARAWGFFDRHGMDEASFTLGYLWAFTLGLSHSLEPSHAKVVLASWFLNRRRTAMEAVLFALTVTVAHTLVIYLLALAGQAFGATFALDLNRGATARWSGLAGGVLMMAIGLWMFWDEFRAGFHREGGANHDHPHGHFFHHHHYGHDHPSPSSLRQIFIMGFCSGAVPCVSGLAVMLLAWRVSLWYGLALVALFSAGLGIVVLVMCLAMQQAASAMDRYWKESARWTRFLPVLSASIICLMGLVVVLQTGHQ